MAILLYKVYCACYDLTIVLLREIVYISFAENKINAAIFNSYDGNAIICAQQDIEQGFTLQHRALIFHNPMIDRLSTREHGCETNGGLWWHHGQQRDTQVSKFCNAI